MVLSSFLLSIMDLLSTVIRIYTWILIIGVVMSWLNVSPYNNFAQIIHKLTSPAYRLVNKIIPNTVFNGIDIAPMILILGLNLINNFMFRLIASAS